MKKLIVCILCLASTHVFAQFRLGLQGSFSSLNCWQSEQQGGLPTGAQTRQINGFEGGFVAEYDLGYSGFMLRPALLLAENGTNLGNTQGFENPNTYTIGYSSSYLRFYSVRLPVNFVYEYAVSDKWRVFAGFGPYLSKNISGTEKGYYQLVFNSSNEATAYAINNTMKTSSDESYAPAGISNMAGFDFGADFLIGFSYKRVAFSASFNRGFTEMYHTVDTDLGNQFWNFTVTYRLFGHYRKPKM